MTPAIIVIVVVLLVAAAAAYLYDQRRKKERAELQERFGARRAELLQARRERGKPSGFLEETAEIMLKVLSDNDQLPA